MQRAKSLNLPRETYALPQDCVLRMTDLQAVLGENFSPLDKWTTSDIHFSEIEEDHMSQKWWSHKVHTARARKLDRMATLRDRVRLSLQRMPGTTTWLTVTPNEGLGRKLEGRDSRYLLKWWLGRPIVDPSCRTFPCCEGPMDIFGDHFVSCKHNQPQQRHHPFWMRWRWNLDPMDSQL